MAATPDDIRAAAIIAAILMLAEYLADNARGYSFDTADVNKHVSEAWQVYNATKAAAP